eukprot:362351-Chlamydomonas_euryale.AAC.4
MGVHKRIHNTLKHGPTHGNFFATRATCDACQTLLVSTTRFRRALNCSDCFRSKIAAQCCNRLYA